MILIAQKHQAVVQLLLIFGKGVFIEVEREIVGLALSEENQGFVEEVEESVQFLVGFLEHSVELCDAQVIHVIDVVTFLNHLLVQRMAMEVVAEHDVVTQVSSLIFEGSFDVGNQVNIGLLFLVPVLMHEILFRNQLIVKRDLVLLCIEEVIETEVVLVL